MYLKNLFFAFKINYKASHRWQENIKFIIKINPDSVIRKLSRSFLCMITQTQTITVSFNAIDHPL